MNSIKFIEYTGDYPNLCRGNLTIEVNGKIYDKGFSLSSGGSVNFDDDWMEHVEEGRWSVVVPDELSEYQQEIEDLVNRNVSYGCCGGCI
jgi:outer membrane protease